MSLTSEEYIAQLRDELKKLGGMMAVGATYPLLGDYVAPGSVALKGQSVTSAMYADALAWAQANGLVKTEADWQALKAAGGDVPFFSEGDGTSTFRFPYVAGRGMFVFGVAGAIGEATEEGIVTQLARHGVQIAELEKRVPAGTVIAFAANSAPEGYLLCNGAAVSRATYAALFSAIGTTYGAGDGSSTFQLPDLTDRFIQGSGTAGTVKAAGLPNLSGNFDIRDTSSGTAAVSGGSGVFHLSVRDTSFSTSMETSTTDQQGITVAFRASRSSAVYGNSTTVQPPALTMRHYIKY